MLRSFDLAAHGQRACEFQLNRRVPCRPLLELSQPVDGFKRSAVSPQRFYQQQLAAIHSRISRQSLFGVGHGIDPFAHLSGKPRQAEIGRRMIRIQIERG